MTEMEDLFLGGVDTHSPDDIRAALEGGLDPLAPSTAGLPSPA